MAVHPAELDGALQLGGALAPVGPAADGATATRLPFGVDESLVRRGADEAWAVRGGGPDALEGLELALGAAWPRGAGFARVCGALV